MSRYSRFLLKIVLFTIFIVVLLSFLGYIIIRNIEEENKNYLFMIYSAILGVLCILIGVALTLSQTYRLEQFKTKKGNIPEIYIPLIYDISKAVFINFLYDSDIRFQIRFFTLKIHLSQFSISIT